MSKNAPIKIAWIWPVIILGIFLLIIFQTGRPKFPLTVEITPAETNYSLAKYSHIKPTLNEPPPNAFRVHFRVSNPNSTPCAIAVMTCSFDENWGTDSTYVSPCVWGCDGNFPYGIPLFTAGRSESVYAGELPIVVRTNAQLGELRFRMCFVSIKEKCTDNISRALTNWVEGIHWSKEITINVVP